MTSREGTDRDPLHLEDGRKDEKGSKVRDMDTNERCGAVRPRLRSKLAILAVSAMALALALSMAACVPRSDGDAGSQTGSATAASDVSVSSTANEDMDLSHAKSFYSRDAGMLPSNAWNVIYLNAGSRGCNSCHESMDDVTCTGAEQHPITRSGNTSTHNTTILDGCLSCHQLHTVDYGMYFADAIHTAHYSSKDFQETLGGNCWSCHVVTDTSDLSKVGTTDIKLWEEVEYTAGLGGYPDLQTNALTRRFMQYNGHENGTVTNVASDESDKATYELTDVGQDVSTQQDSFTAFNHAGMYGESDLYDFSHTVSITGVNDPRTFTYDELKAMPQTTITMTNQCAVAGSAGHDIYNATYTGVSLEYLVGLCGGLVDGNNQVYTTGWDEWNCVYANEPASQYVGKSIVALKYYDDDLPYEFGGPMALLTPGMAGGFQCKWIKTIDFSQGANPVDYATAACGMIPGDEVNTVSGAWLENDGVAFSIKDGVSLKGYVYALADTSPLTAMEFSTDLGATWQRISIPSGMDPYQWVTFTFNWHPEKTGTYIVKVRGVNAQGTTNYTEGSVYVTVTD